MKIAIATALLGTLAAYAPSSSAASETPAVAAGRDFTCVMRADSKAQPGFVSCTVDRAVLAEDHETIAIEKGWRLNGVIAESGDKIFWKAVQTGDRVGDLIYAREETMTSRLPGPLRAGDVLTVSVSRALVLPKIPKD